MAAARQLAAALIEAADEMNRLGWSRATKVGPSSRLGWRAELMSFLLIVR